MTAPWPDASIYGSEGDRYTAAERAARKQYIDTVAAAQAAYDAATARQRAAYQDTERAAWKAYTEAGRAAWNQYTRHLTTAPDDMSQLTRQAYSEIALGPAEPETGPLRILPTFTPHPPAAQPGQPAEQPDAYLTDHRYLDGGQ